MKILLGGVILGIILSTTAVGISAVALPDSEPSARKDNTRVEMFEQIGLFIEVMQRARVDYVEEIDERAALEVAIDSMLGSLDPHSGYMNPEEFAALQVTTSGEYGGLGIEVTMEDGFVKVIAPMDGTPASRAGIESGDLLTAIDGRVIVGLDLDEAVDTMRGEPGTDLTLTVYRVGQDPFDVTLIREVIEPEYVTFEHKGDGIAYIRIATFNNSKTTIKLIEALAQVRQIIGKQPQGIILDLRNNGGGLLEEAVSVSAQFLPDGDEIVSVIGRRVNDVARFNASEGQNFQGVPMVVLINGGSASASEIVAGALQDHKRATIIGMTSFGKGSVQTVIPLGAERGAIRLTTARYYTPSGRAIQATGIKPDFEIANRRVSEEDLRRIQRYSEANLPNALDSEVNDGHDRPHIPAQMPPEDYQGTDYQLEKAVEFLQQTGRSLAVTETQTG